MQFSHYHFTVQQPYIKSIVQRYQKKLKVVKQQDYSLNTPQTVKFTSIISQNVENAVVLEKYTALPSRNDYVQKKFKSHVHPHFIQDDIPKIVNITEPTVIFSYPNFTLSQGRRTNGTPPFKMISHFSSK